MNKVDQKALTPRSEDQSKWYTEVITRSKLADYTPVRGCMVIRPYGYAMWEKIQEILGGEIKKAGVQNAYFPLFIPESFFQKEKEHVEGFSPEVAVVTYAGGEELEEKLIVRPTSETIINYMFSQWVQSYRDLPLKINQWCNVVRWEKRTVPFLRTTEFLWQEGHTIHATKEEAEVEVLRALEMYRRFCEDYLAMKAICGYKTEKEKFAGAVFTTSFENLMKDGKALQSGTSHLLGQNFARAFDTKVTDEEGKEQFVWQTSWGTSTRLIGGVIMAHGDDKGLVLPPKVAPVQVIVIPIFTTDQKDVVTAHVAKVEKQLEEIGARFETDWSENSPGFKFADSEMRGIPIRLEVGPKDVEKDSVLAVNRFDGTKIEVSLAELAAKVPELLEKIQNQLLAASKAFTEENIHEAKTYEEFKSLAESTIGYIKVFFCGEPEVERKIQEETRYTSRCIPLETYNEEGPCFVTCKPGKLTLFAKAY